MNKFNKVMIILSLSLSLSSPAEFQRNVIVAKAAEHEHTDACGNGSVHHHEGSPTEKGGCWDGTAYWEYCGGKAVGDIVSVVGMYCDNCGIAYVTGKCGKCGKSIVWCKNCENKTYSCIASVRCYGNTCGLQDNTMYGDFSKHADCNHCNSEKYPHSDSETIYVNCPGCGNSVSALGFAHHIVCYNDDCMGVPWYVYKINQCQNCGYSYNFRSSLKIKDVLSQLQEYCIQGCNHLIKVNDYDQGIYLLTEDDLYIPTETICNKIVSTIVPKK